MTLPKTVLSQEKEETTKEDPKKLKRQTTVDDKLSLSFYEMHKTIDTKSATPEKFLNFVSLYDNVYDSKKEGILVRKEKLSKGVSKLKEAREKSGPEIAGQLLSWSINKESA